MTPALSIVMPMLNEAATLPTQLAHLQSLRAQGVELVVVDGGSTDNSVVLCVGLADRVLHSEPGRARQMNAGARACTADTLLFLHADTRLPKQALALVQQALGAPQPPAKARVWGRFDVQIEGRSAWLPVVAVCMNQRSRWSGIATGDQALFMRRVVFDALGGFADQPLMEDIELCKRLRQHGPPVCLRAKVSTSGRRWDTRGPWRTIWLMWRLRWLYARGASPQQLAALYAQ